MKKQSGGLFFRENALKVRASPGMPWNYYDLPFSGSGNSSNKTAAEVKASAYPFSEEK
ncbi:MAG: hypothetical protein J6M48_10830 [Ruminococcus sp.]|nr:hypothetical protein [Ruminococcus sp.]